MFNKVKRILKSKKKSPPVSTTTTTGSDDTKVASYATRRIKKGSCGECCLSNCVCDAIGGCFDSCGDCCCCCGRNRDECCYDDCDGYNYNKNSNCCNCGVIGCQCDLGQCGSCCC